MKPSDEGKTRNGKQNCSLLKPLPRRTVLPECVPKKPLVCWTFWKQSGHYEHRRVRRLKWHGKDWRSLDNGVRFHPLHKRSLYNKVAPLRAASCSLSLLVEPGYRRGGSFLGKKKDDLSRSNSRSNTRTKRYGNC